MGNYFYNASASGCAYSANGPKPHAVSQAGSYSFTYDCNGNMRTRVISGTTYTLGYDVENHMISVTGGSVNASFSYDGDGNRVKGTVGGVTTYYIGNYYEWTGSTSTAKKYYYAGAQRMALRQGTSTVYFLLGDHLGSTSITADGSSGAYDALYRLTAADYEDGRFFHYAYDAAVNRGAPAQPVKGEGRLHPVGVQLPDPQANRIVRVNRGVRQRVGDAHLAVEGVIRELGDVALGVGLGEPVAARVVGEFGADVLVGGFGKPRLVVPDRRRPAVMQFGVCRRSRYALAQEASWQASDLTAPIATRRAYHRSGFQLGA